VGAWGRQSRQEGWSIDGRAMSSVKGGSRLALISTLDIKAGTGRGRATCASFGAERWGLGTHEWSRLVAHSREPWLVSCAAWR
jgi:hypothetical protein